MPAWIDSIVPSFARFVNGCAQFPHRCRLFAIRSRLSREEQSLQAADGALRHVAGQLHDGRLRDQRLQQRHGLPDERRIPLIDRHLRIEQREGARGREPLCPVLLPPV